MSWLTWFFILLLLAAAIGAALVAYRTYMFGDSGINLGAFLFKSRRPEPPLSVIEQAPVDGRRRLVLRGRRDGGPAWGGPDTGARSRTASRTRLFRIGRS